MNSSQIPFHILFVGQDNLFWQRCKAALSVMNDSFLIEFFPDLSSVVKTIKKATSTGLVFLYHPEKSWMNQALRDIKNEVLCEGLAAVICVAENNETLIEDAFKSGTNVVLTMPDNEIDLIERLEDLIGQIKQLHLFNFQKDTFLILR